MSEATPSPDPVGETIEQFFARVRPLDDNHRLVEYYKHHLARLKLLDPRGTPFAKLEGVVEHHLADVAEVERSLAEALSHV